MIIALRWLRIPDRNAVFVPGRLTSSSCASERMSSAIPRDSPSTAPSSRGVNSSNPSGIWPGPAGTHPSAGRRRISSATAACLRLLTYAPTRSHAAIAPSNSSSEAPGYRSSSPAASSANWASVRHPDATSSGLPDANPDARLAYTPGKLSADPGIPGPRRPVAVAASAAIAAVRPSPAMTAAIRAWSPVIWFAPATSSSSSTSGGGASSGSSSRSRSPGSASPARAARYAGSSIQAGHDGTRRGSSSRPGSGETGPRSMYHDPFERNTLSQT